MYSRRFSRRKYGMRTKKPMGYRKKAPMSYKFNYGMKSYNSTLGPKNRRSSSVFMFGNQYDKNYYGNNRRYFGRRLCRARISKKRRQCRNPPTKGKGGVYCSWHDTEQKRKNASRRKYYIKKEEPGFF